MIGGSYKKTKIALETMVHQTNFQRYVDAPLGADFTHYSTARELLQNENSKESLIADVKRNPNKYTEKLKSLVSKL